MAKGNPESPKSPTKELSDSDTSEEEQVNPMLRTIKEERHYGTIPGSALATQHSATPGLKLTQWLTEDLVAR